MDPICLGNISKDWSVDNMKKTGFTGYGYFYYDIIDLENFDSRLLKIHKKSYKDTGIYNIGYITIKKIDDCININSVNPLYLRIAHASGYIECNSVEEKDTNKYLIFDSTDENKELLKNIMVFLMELEENKGNMQWWMWLWKRLHESQI